MRRYVIFFSIDPLVRPTVTTAVIIIFTRCARPFVRLSVRFHFSKSSKAKDFSSENIDRYWWKCKSVRGDY